jgi:RimJ/RimL family protein N-acetyltransferase
MIPYLVAIVAYLSVRQNQDMMNDMKSFTIRPLQASDTRALLAYVNELIAEDTYLMLSGKKMTLTEEKRYVQDSLARMKKKEKIHLVATVGDRIVGSAEIRRGEKRKHHMGEIGLAILPSHRGQGLGKHLMELLISEGKRIGLRMVMLRCFENNTVALALYKKHGFVECGMLPEAFNFRGMYIGEVTLYRNI